MIIQKIELFRLAMPFKSGRDLASDEEVIDVYNAADPNLKQMESLLIKLTTDSGLTGWGESFGHLINPVTFSALKERVGRFFIGQNVPESEDALRKLITQAKYAFHPFGSGGPVMFALSGIDIALWDLLAKIKQQPLYRLLGSQRKEIGVYASLVSYGDKIDIHVKRAKELGFNAVKLHEIVVEDIQKARSALPDDFPLMVDVNCPWDEQQAVANMLPLQNSNLAWLEEPVFPPNDVVVLNRLRKMGIPIAAGENIDGVQGFEQHFINGAIDVAQPSVCKIGGITAMLDIFAMAKKYDVKVVPHCFYYGAGLLATAHLVSTLSSDIELEAPFIQWSETLYPQMEFLPKLTLSDEAGLGFNPDAAIFDRYIIEYSNIDFSN